jgi:RNA polymerase sigma-70 factor, ECF subfamily
VQSESLNHTSHQQLKHDDLITLYEDLSPRLFRYAVRLLGDANLAEECVAETFSRLLQALKSGGGPRDHISGYLFRTAHNWITDYYRSGIPQDLKEPGWVDDPLTSPQTILVRAQEKERVRSALLQLTSEQRQVIMLRFYEQWHHEEIAAAIGKTAEATRALQHRAIANLRRMLLGTDD